MKISFLFTSILSLLFIQLHLLAQFFSHRSSNNKRKKRKFNIFRSLCSLFMRGYFLLHVDSQGAIKRWFQHRKESCPFSFVYVACTAAPPVCHHSLLAIIRSLALSHNIIVERREATQTIVQKCTITINECCIMTHSLSLIVQGDLLLSGLKCAMCTDERALSSPISFRNWF
jgi:hypothetical protein